ncbi:hypothetical protein FKM82_002891 [Ascaphus truei]
MCMSLCLFLRSLNSSLLFMGEFSPLTFCVVIFSTLAICWFKISCASVCRRELVVRGCPVVIFRIAGPYPNYCFGCAKLCAFRCTPVWMNWGEHWGGTKITLGVFNKGWSGALWCFGPLTLRLGCRGHAGSRKKGESVCGVQCGTCSLESMVCSL